jgi:hypothetical protein
MKRLVHKLVLFAPLMIMVAIVNWTVDPSHIFHPGDEKKIAELIAAGHNVSGPPNYDDRAVQAYLTNRPENYEVIVVGTSRSFMISSAQFSGRSFFNHSFTAGMLEEFAAFYGLYSSGDQSKRPSIFVISIDPYVFNPHRTIRDSLLINGYPLIGRRLQTMPQRDQRVPFTHRFKINKMIELFSFPYFQRSLSKLINEPRAEFKPSSLPYGEETIKRADGSMAYPEFFRKRTIQQVHEDAVYYCNANPVFLLGSFTEIDKSATSLLEEFVETLQSDGVEVVFFLPPYHPYTYNYLMKSDKYRIISDVENYLQKLAGVKGIKVLGSYNPDACQCAESEFYDGSHTKETCVDKIFQRAGFQQQATSRFDYDTPRN